MSTPTPTLPPYLVIRYSVLPYLSTVDALAVKLTCRHFYYAANRIRTKVTELQSPRVTYWVWVFRTMRGACECGLCKPMYAFYYTLAKQAPVKVMRHFLNTKHFFRVVGQEPESLNKMVRGAIESGSIQKVILARGVVPQHYLVTAVRMAVQYRNSRAFHFLMDVGHCPSSWETQMLAIYRAAGMNADHTIYTRLLSENVHNGDLSLVKEMVVEAIVFDHPEVLESVWYHDMTQAFDESLVDLAIRHDRLACLKLILESLWITEEDSARIMLYNAVCIGRWWYATGLPAYPHVRAWMATL